MAPSTNTERTTTPVPKSASAKGTSASRRSSINEAMDSSRTAQAMDAAMSLSPEPATAAMVDVSSWAQRGLVLENKDLRRTLEMTKSAHSAQLAQIAKRQKTEKEELEVKLEAEVCRQHAQKRSLEELAASLEEARRENAKLVEKDQALHQQLLTQIEENKRLHGDLQEADDAIKTTEEERDAIRIKQEDLIARESRVAVVLNDQHNKIMTLSQAYHDLETDNDQLRTALDAANGETARMKARMSGILGTLAKVVRDNGDEVDFVDGTDRKASPEPRKRLPRTVPLGRQRGRAFDQLSLALPETPLSPVADAQISGDSATQNRSQTPIRKMIEDTLISDSPIGESSNGVVHQAKTVTGSRGRGARTKRRRVVSDPEAVNTQFRPLRNPIKEEPSQADAMMLDSAAAQDEDKTTRLEIQDPRKVAGLASSQDKERAVTVGAKKIMDAGEESPERDAVESAVDVQDDRQGLHFTKDEGNRTVGKSQPTTYAKKRKAVEPPQITSDRPETPMPGDRPDTVTQTLSPGIAFSTPLANRSKTSPNQHSSYITRSKIAKSSKIASDPNAPGSPFTMIRSHTKTSKGDEEQEKSPGIVHVKEEVSDSIFDGTPRITGGDDEDDPLCI